MDAPRARGPMSGAAAAKNGGKSGLAASFAGSAGGDADRQVGQHESDVGEEIPSPAAPWPAARTRSIVGVWGALPVAPPWRLFEASWELMALARLSDQRPDYAIDSVRIGGERRAVSERAVLSTPFCQLLHFEREGGAGDPKVLLIAPMSGHFATLLRGAIRTLLRDHQVFVTDWINPRHIRREEGGFGLEDYTQHILDFIRHVGDDCHVVAICQATVPALAAAAIIAQRGDAFQPASLTLMAGPIDVRAASTSVNTFARAKPIEWFRDNLIRVVPPIYEGRGRRIYPGFLQLCAFMSLNPGRHASSFAELFRMRLAGNVEQADAIWDFYREYFAVMDLTADFYLETVDQVFQRCLLPAGEMTFKGVRIDPGAIRKTPLLTVEGGNDDICGAGQTAAAQALCSGLSSRMKRHYVQPGVGHFGVFSGQRWESELYPVVRDYISACRA
ncbi:MAG TPA: polyhydroxyalkanoate depolymerase [Roseiarcus sp.]|nr:polyhydroxyalkanoate depolymerase [Roseiarcus sp.]